MRSGKLKNMLPRTEFKKTEKCVQKSDVVDEKI